MSESSESSESDGIVWQEANAHFEYGVRGSVLVMRRLEGTRPEPEELLPCYERAVELGKAGRSPGLVIDTRASRGRSTPEFERMISQAQRRLLEVYPRLVVLVKSKVGRMQASRLSGRHLLERRIVVTDDEDAVWKLVRAPGPQPSTPGPGADGLA